MTFTPLQNNNRFNKIGMLFLFICAFGIANTYAQNGLNFQGVARGSNNVILASQQISLRLSILQGSATGAVEYAETKIVNTNAQGLFTTVIGDAGALTTLGNFNTINWRNTPKFLKIELDPTAGSNFTTMGTTQFQYVAYAQFANSVDASNIFGIVPVDKGGTGVGSISALKSALAIDKASLGLSNVDNTSDILKPISNATNTALDLKANTVDVANSLASKVDKVSGKDLSTNDYTSAEKNKLATITGTNTGDQDLSPYATNIALALKANATDVAAGLGLKENAANKSVNINLGTSDDLYPTQNAVKAYVDGQMNSVVVADGSIHTRHIADGSITGAKLAGLIATTNGGTGVATTTANTFFAGPDGFSGAPNFRTLVARDLPTNSTGYIQNSTSLQASSNFNISDNGVIGKKLTINGIELGVGGNGTVLSNIAVGSDALKVVAPNGFGVGGIENIAIGTTTLNSNTNGADNTAIGHYALKYNTTGANNSALGTYSLMNSTSGSSNTSIAMSSLINNTTGDANTAIGVNALYTNRIGSYNTAIGFNADVASNNLTNATAIGNGASVATSNTIQLGNGSVTLVNTSGAITASGYNGPLNGNATSATTAITAGNITATSNSTLTSLPNLAMVGTITSGVWSGTAINASTLTGTSLNSTITGSSLTSVGTLTSATINGKLIVGASSAVTSSAILEASSNSQGFLPPRMNYYQRTQIASPVAGLTIWCSNCGGLGEMQVYNGGAWTNMCGGAATSTINLSIGDSYQGGLVAYILQVGDQGYDANTQHGLIAATSDQSMGIQWSNGTLSLTGASGTGIGTGLSNTNTIIFNQGAVTTNYAAGLARAYNGGGYTDWYLPSKDELTKLYAMKLLGYGGFSNNKYWSSTENGGVYTAWYRDFSNGYLYALMKDELHYVRAIRSF